MRRSYWTAVSGHKGTITAQHWLVCGDLSRQAVIGELSGDFYEEVVAALKERGAWGYELYGFSLPGK